jgi:hypothetical protein
MNQRPGDSCDSSAWRLHTEAALLSFLVVFAAFFFAPAFAFAATPVSGTLDSDTTWTAVNSPYVIFGTLTVSSGATLTIEPGTIVKFSTPDSLLDVVGTVFAYGTGGSPVYFTSIKDDSVGGDTNGDGNTTSPTPADWTFIIINASGAVTLNHTTVRYGGGGTYGVNANLYNGGGTITISDSVIERSIDGIYHQIGTTTIQNSAIRNNGRNGVYHSGGATNVSGSAIVSNVRYGVYATGSGTFSLTGNTFSDNAIAAGAISFGSLIFTHSGNTVSATGLHGFVVSGTMEASQTWNAGDAPYIVSSSLAIPSGTTLTIEPGAIIKFIDHNGLIDVHGILNANGTAATPIYFTSLRDDTIGGDTNGDGSATTPGAGDFEAIFASAGGTTLDHAIVRYGGNGAYGYGANLWGNGGTLTISDSVIERASHYGIFSLGGTTRVNGSVIRNNGSYGVYNSTTNILNAENNYWGSATGPTHVSNPSGTGDRVSDYVDFIPFLTTEPVIEGEAVRTKPPTSTSWYVNVTSKEKDQTLYTWMYKKGYEAGQNDLSLPGTQHSVAILDFGQPQIQGGVYGASGFGRFVSVTVIKEAAKQFAQGYYLGTGTDRESQMRMVIGTSNYNTAGAVTYTHGQAWIQLVKDIGTSLQSIGDGSRVSVRGGIDIEMSYSTSSAAYSWVNGYADSWVAPYSLYDYGSANGCPPVGQCDNGWTQDNVWYVAWGATPSLPLPEIYNTLGTNAKQWQQLSLYSYQTHGGSMFILGPLSQNAAWKQRCPPRPKSNDPCYQTNNTPDQAWYQLWTELNSDPQTAQDMLWSTDIKWRK